MDVAIVVERLYSWLRNLKNMHVQFCTIDDKILTKVIFAKLQNYVGKGKKIKCLSLDSFVKKWIASSFQ